MDFLLPTNALGSSASIQGVAPLHSVPSICRPILPQPPPGRNLRADHRSRLCPRPENAGAGLCPPGDPALSRRQGNAAQGYANRQETQGSPTGQGRTGQSSPVSQEIQRYLACKGMQGRALPTAGRPRAIPRARERQGSALPSARRSSAIAGKEIQGRALPSARRSSAISPARECRAALCHPPERSSALPPPGSPHSKKQTLVALNRQNNLSPCFIPKYCT
jgi:hypothetical protein